MIDTSLLPQSTFGLNSQILEKSFPRICTDTRKIQPGDLFIALKGENFDAFDFLEAALEKGAAAVACSRNQERQPLLQSIRKRFPEKTIFEVEDSLVFLQDLARSHLLWWKSLKNKKVIVLTGSNGKTTNKEFLRQFFEAIMPGQVLATEGNLNNHIGLPLTILRLKPEHGQAIFEIGTNHPGEIKFLSEMSLADFCYITNVGDAHIEFFKTRENIFKEKSEIYHFTKKFSREPYCYLCNADDDLLKAYASEPRVVTASTKNSNSDFYFEIDSSDKIYMTVAKKGTKKELQNVQIFERHNKLNLCLCLSIALVMCPEKESELLKEFSRIKLPSNNRSNLIQKAGQTIYLDAYNANPSSMHASITSFIDYLKKEKRNLDECLFVIGDMNELGEQAEELHRELGAFIQGKGINHVTFVGRYVEYFRKGYTLPLKAYPSVKEIDKTKLLNSSKIIYLKGSRSIKLETLVDI
jgi:UDP-N-acetylmuramoyl-tripeptide--D-alanyl-D-alanine ligase